MEDLEALRGEIAALRGENERLRAQRRGGAERSSTPYDDAWRTLTTSAPQLLIPMVNEVFGEHFSEGARVLLHPNEQLFATSEGRTERRVTDTNFSLLEEPGLLGEGFEIREDSLRKQYLFECESKAVNSAILVRMTEYAVKAGVRSAERTSRVNLRVYIPQSAVLSLRSTESTPEEMELEIIMERGSGSSTVRIMKLSDYTPEVILEKKLYLLIPFLLFNYEKQFQYLQENEEAYDALLEEVRSVFQRVDALISEEHESALIDTFTSKALRAMTHTVVNGLTEKYPKLQKGVNGVVGGNIIEFEALRIKREALQEGLQQGLQRGKQEGVTDAFNTMTERLINLGTDGSTIEAVTGYDRKRINAIAQRLHRTVSWG